MRPFGFLSYDYFDMGKKMTLPILSHSLAFQHLGGAAANGDVYSPRAVLKISVNPVDHVVHPMVYELLNEGTLVVKSSVSSKSIFAGVQYVIAKQTDNGFAAKTYYLDSIEGVKTLLAEGWKICKYTPRISGYLDILVPADSEYLVDHVDLSARWREAVAAVINCEIESECHWTTSGVFGSALTAALKSFDNVVVPADCAFLDPGEVVTAEEFVSSYVTRCLETYLNTVHDFVREDQYALYFAEPTAGGVQISRYADVRAILWEMRSEQERIAREQAIEEGLGG